MTLKHLNFNRDKARRIMIIGRSGSGKSTFAIQLQQKLNIPLFHLDKVFFEKNWRERNYQEFLSMQEGIVAQPSWIIDGNATKSYEMRYAYTDLCLYFNFPRWLCYWRVFKRLFHKHPDIDDRAPNCPETVRWSLLKYMWSFENRVDPLLKRLKSTYPKVEFIELRNDAEVLRLMRVMQRATS